MIDPVISVTGSRSNDRTSARIKLVQKLGSRLWIIRLLVLLGLTISLCSSKGEGMHLLPFPDVSLSTEIGSQITQNGSILYQLSKTPDDLSEFRADCHVHILQVSPLCLAPPYEAESSGDPDQYLRSDRVNFVKTPKTTPLFERPPPSFSIL